MLMPVIVNDSHKEFTMATRKYRRSASRNNWRKTTRRPHTSRRHTGGRPWSGTEISFMRRHYRTNTTKWVARQLGRTVYSVRYKASSLRIRKANPSVWKQNHPTTRPTQHRRQPNLKTRWARTTRRSFRQTASRRHRRNHR
jgi:hypothetical protein